ncbi:MAG: Gfo/Idh/MocA family oxidoreductase [Hyphomicrobiales bacterium]
MNSNVASISVIGAGLIGKRHIHHISREAELASIVDPDHAAKDLAAELNVPYFSSISQMISSNRPDGAVIATPNRLHETHGIECLQEGLPVLIEKPITSDLASAERLVTISEDLNTPILVGQHRRHNPLIKAAKEVIEKGSLGEIQAIQGTCWLFKPDDYFDTAWRVGAGSGPILINLIHDIDLMRYLCGEIETVQALKSSRVRGLGVEETAAIMMRFCNGILCTFSLSDVIASPLSWELSSGENSAYPMCGGSCYHFGGTHGSLSLPDFGLWHHVGLRSWWSGLSRASLPYERVDPLAVQARHFSDVCLGKSAPLVSGREGLETLRVIEAIITAAECEETIEVASRV